MPFEIALTVFIGLVLGSFATALSYRLPRDISIVRQVRSQCPACHHNLSFGDLVPVFSWLFLRGKCRYCKTKIGSRYPLIELATLALCLAFYSVYGLKPETCLVFALAPVLVSIADIDLHYKIIPDGLNLSIFLLGVASFFVVAAVSANPESFVIEKGPGALGASVIYGAGAWVISFTSIRLFKREALGWGDIKFFAATGVWIGLVPDALSLLLFCAGASGIILALIWKKRTGEAEFPFGPSLILAFIVILLLYPPPFMEGYVQ
jgi:leader peptidase (prepilin peptidase)/N-methyltransferase